MYPSMLRDSQRARPPAGSRSSSKAADHTEGFAYNGRVAVCLITSLLCILSVDNMSIASGMLVACLLYTSDAADE